MGGLFRKGDRHAVMRVTQAQYVTRFVGRIGAKRNPPLRSSTETTDYAFRLRSLSYGGQVG